MDSIEEIRITEGNDCPVNQEGEFVLYWMTAYRRAKWNYALQRAVDWSLELGKGLLVVEVLPVDYPWASQRFHQFVLDGMKENWSEFNRQGTKYLALLEERPNQASRFLQRLAEKASLVVTDEFPSSPDGRSDETKTGIPVRIERVDSNGLLPLQASDKVFLTAYSFRRFLQKALPAELQKPPKADPLDALEGIPSPSLPTEVTHEVLFNPWEQSDLEPLGGLSIDQQVLPTSARGGSRTASALLEEFLKTKLARYSEFRSHPAQDVTSQLSPYLHFGHISTHQVLFELMSQEHWSPARLSPVTNGSKKGWWGVSESAEAFLDELVTWRELGFNMSSKQPDHHLYRSLPDWAKKTLAEHEDDPRPFLYDMAAFETAETHDALWNAAQRQLLEEGRIHNYLRMLWGKKILEWSERPREALRVMIELNNKYALDGSDPNSFSGIFWVLGRYDRPWGPERPIFGKIRYMSSENTARKFPVKEYLTRYGI